MEPPTGEVPPAATPTYRVADLLVDVTRAQVWRGGTELPLPRLSFNLLLALIEAAPGIVSVDELMDRVWPGLVVSPETVSQRAKLLRYALGDDPKAPRYVTSVRGRGYRLVAPVVTPAADAPAPPVLLTRPAAPGADRRAWPRVVLVLAGALLAIAALIALIMPARQAHQVPAAAERSVAVLPFESVGEGAAGDVLAFGIAEAVLHQLANLPGLIVIARSSSFAVGTGPVDVRALGQQLGARYLLEGSVQQEPDRLRVTAQLIDTATGAHVWSLRFDKGPHDVFAVQDEIAARVASAFELSVQAGGVARTAGRGTSNFDAYLTYLQGRSLLASGRTDDARAAIVHFQRALQLDPAFAAAHVSLAEAEVFTAEFTLADDRDARFAAALLRAQDSLDKALALDPQSGAAHVVRGYCEAFTDLPSAEASYRRGLQLVPNDARGYAGLAAVLFEQPARRDEALQMLERARRLDPLEPAHDVAKAVFLLYDRGDAEGADAVLRNVLQRLPDYLPALTRLGELDYCCLADASEAIELLERAVALDPRAHWPRRVLVRVYLDLGDVDAAEAVIAQSAVAKEILQVPVLVQRGDWRRAGELAYQALAQGQVAPFDENVAVLAIRRHARLTNQYARAIEALTAQSGVRWHADRSVDVPLRPSLRVASIGLADMLQASGDAAAARELLDGLLGQMRTELQSPGRSATWYCKSMSVALALRGEPEQALDWLERGLELRSVLLDQRLTLEAEPAFDSVRESARFRAIARRVQDHVRRERNELDALRSAGRLANRG